MPNEYWARRAIKQVRSAYPSKDVKAEIFDMGSRCGILIDGKLLSLHPQDDAMTKAAETFGEA